MASTGEPTFLAYQVVRAANTTVICYDALGRPIICAPHEWPRTGWFYPLKDEYDNIPAMRAEEV